MFCHLLVRALSCFYKKVKIIDFGTLSNLLFKYGIFHENKSFISSFEMCCFNCFHLKVDFSVQWCTAREQVCCDFYVVCGSSGDIASYLSSSYSTSLRLL